MSRYYSYINSAKQILQAYHGEEPFASFLKKYFSANKKYGSKDRKHISNLCYCFFRLGKAGMDLDAEERILTGLFLSTVESNEILATISPEWNDKVRVSINEKLLIIKYSLLIPKIFPWQSELSCGIDHKKFCESFLVQPDLFIRLRPGKEDLVKHKLKNAGIEFLEVSGSALALPNTSKLENIIRVDKEAVIQDHSSQLVGGFIKSEIEKFDKDVSVWDCCAASGGKSIMTYDINPEIQLTVSDIRESILANLKKRFQKAEINNYKSFVIDLEKNNIQQSIINNQFSMIIADVPCSGSGTWSRTPEQLFYFDERKIDEYASLQKKILSNIIPHLKPGGSLIYITCSVFKKENEEVAEFARSDLSLRLIKQEVIKGYDKRADSMFVAVLGKDL